MNLRNENYYSTVKKLLIIILILNLLVAFLNRILWRIYQFIKYDFRRFHSLFDSTSNIIGLIGISIASRPADSKHPYGYNKFETFASIGIAALLFITCFEIIQSALNRLFAPQTPEITIISFLIMIITIIINTSVSWYESRKGKEIGSSILIADSLHSRSDIYASFAVIFSFIAIIYGYSIVDPLIAFFIAFLIALMGIKIIKQNSNVLLDKTPVDEKIIKNIVNSMDKIKGNHRIRTRGSKSYIFVYLHIILDSCYTLNESHNIAHEVEKN
jgi:cation diffusion facilitator family transporter